MERHRAHRSGWLRAAVLGANDGIVSTSALMIGVAATGAERDLVLTSGVAGLVAGALSMAAGEYVSVSSQRDAEHADLLTERRELETAPEAELRELTEIYVGRGLDRPLAEEVARQMHDHDALAAHRRDELGLTEELAARPSLAAMSSAGAFLVGAAVPVVAGTASVAPLVLAVVALVALAALGAVGAVVGGARSGRAAVRVLVGGGLAMAFTFAIGALIG